MVLQILLFIISASLEDFVVGLSYGIKKIRITLFNNIIIASISGTFTLIAMLSGRLAAKIIPEKLEVWLGSGLLILIGVYFLYCWLKQKYSIHHAESDHSKIDIYEEFLNHPEIADADHSSSIDLKESIVIGIALSMNNFGLGLGASIIGLNIAACCIFSSLFSIFFIRIGYVIGDSILSNFLRRFAEPVSGLIIVFLGFYTLFF